MTAFSAQVSASNRDSEMASIANDSGRAPTVSGVCTLTNTKLEPGSHGSGDEWSVGAGMVLNVPQGETINSATLTLTAQATYASGGTVRLYISAQAVDNAGVFTTTNGDLNTTARARTTAFATLTVNSVTADVEYSVDVTAVVQEIVNRAGWVSGNAIAFLIDTHEDTTVGEWQDFWGYDGSTTKAPKLAGDYGSVSVTDAPAFIVEDSTDDSYLEWKAAVEASGANTERSQKAHRVADPMPYHLVY